MPHARDAENAFDVRRQVGRDVGNQPSRFADESGGRHRVASLERFFRALLLLIGPLERVGGEFLLEGRRSLLLVLLLKRLDFLGGRRLVLGSGPQADQCEYGKGGREGPEECHGAGPRWRDLRWWTGMSIRVRRGGRKRPAVRDVTRRVSRSRVGSPRPGCRGGRGSAWSGPASFPADSAGRPRRSSGSSGRGSPR